MCSFQYQQENEQLNLDSCSAVLNAPGWNLKCWASTSLCLQANKWHMAYNVHTRAWGCTFKWSLSTTHRHRPPPSLQYGQMNSVNGVQHKGPGCARPYGRTAISAVLQFVHWSFSQHPHLQFKNTQWLESATKLTVHCLSETLFDHALCVNVCVYKFVWN